MTENNNETTPKGKVLIFKYKKSLIAITILWAIWFLIFLGKTFIYENSVLLYWSSQCPNWQVMDSWTEYNDGTIIVENCIEPEICSFGKTLEATCGSFGTHSTCYMSCRWEDDIDVALKPVIYLYPEEEIDIDVRLNYQWDIFVDYPAYDQEIWGWNVKGFPNGNIINKADNKEYSYLFWEWRPEKEIDWDLSTWFVIPWNKSRQFLQDILPKMWMTPKEYNEFIVYWYPIMQNNNYNLIHFADIQYTETAFLQTVPEYDSILRVFMVMKPLDEYIEIPAQSIHSFNRNGFSVVEWGGTILEK